MSQNQDKREETIANVSASVSEPRAEKLVSLGVGSMAVVVCRNSDVSEPSGKRMGLKPQRNGPRGEEDRKEGVDHFLNQSYFEWGGEP